MPSTLLTPACIGLLNILLSLPVGVQQTEAGTGPGSGAVDHPEEVQFSFGLVADIQFARKPDAGRRRYGSSLKRFEQALEDWGDEDLSFLIQLGDLIDGRETAALGEEDLGLVLNACNKRLASGDLVDRDPIPLYHVIGNHGLSLPRGVLQARLGLKRSWYSFVRENWRFVVVDSLWLSTQGRQLDDPLAQDAEAFLARFGEQAPPTDQLPQARPWNGGLGPEQRLWLADELKAAEAAHQHVVVFSHLPVLPASAHPATVLWDAEDVLKILEQAPAFVAWIAGHHHAGGYAQVAGRHFLTMKGMVEAQAGGNAYAVVHATENQLVIDGRGQALDRVLKVSDETLVANAFEAAFPKARDEPVETYMGREVAQTMHWRGAEWLLRESRKDEENSDALLDALHLQPGWTVADFGCGNGYYTLPLAERVGPKGLVVGLDLQPEMLRMLRFRSEQRGETTGKPIRNLVTTPSLPLETGLEPGTYDLILMVDVYHELDRPELVLRQARRALKPDGLLALAEFREEDPAVPIKPQHKMSRATISKELEANGFALARENEDLPMQHLLFFRARW